MKFLNKYNNSKNLRFLSFKKTFEVFLSRNLKTIVHHLRKRLLRILDLRTLLSEKEIKVE